MMRDIVVQGVTIRTKQILVNEERPTMIFLHDSLGCIKLWRDFPEKSGRATNCNVLVYDRQGYGESDPFSGEERKNDYLEKEADVLELVMNECGINKAILFGHSDGGTIALIAASKYPSKIKGVITEGAHIFVEDITLAGIKKAEEDYRTTNLKEKLEKYHSDKTDAVFHAWTKTWLTDEFMNWNIEHFLSGIVCPVLVIQGEKDEFGSLAQVKGIVEQVSGYSESLLIPAVGHTPHKESEGVVIERCLEFERRIG